MFNTWASLALSNAILAFSSFFGVFLLSQGYRSSPRKMPIGSALMAFTLVAASSSLGTLSSGFSSLWSEPHLMLMTAAQALAPPMLAAALASLCWKLNWSRPTWWRILIGLMAGYELARQIGYAEIFLYTVAALSLIVMLVSTVTIARRERTFAVFMTVAILAYGLTVLVITTEGSASGYLRVDLYRYLLALGNLFSASAIFIMLKRQVRTTHNP